MLFFVIFCQLRIGYNVLLHILIVEKISSKKMNDNIHLKIHGVIEVKSMILSQRKILTQIKQHILRLYGHLSFVEY